MDVKEIVPPGAALKKYDNSNPINTDMIPNAIENTMVLSVPHLNLSEVATGIIIIDDTTNSPTTFIDADMVALSKIEKRVLKKQLLNFEIVAKSSSNITRVNFL